MMMIGRNTVKGFWKIGLINVVEVFNRFKKEACLRIVNEMLSSALRLMCDAHNLSRCKAVNSVVDNKQEAIHDKNTFFH